MPYVAPAAAVFTASPMPLDRIAKEEGNSASRVRQEKLVTCGIVTALISGVLIALYCCPLY